MNDKMTVSRDELLQNLLRAVPVLDNEIQRLRARITELEIQSRFAMGSILVKRAVASGVIVPGQPTHEIVDGYTVYERFGGREATINILEAEFHATQIAMRVQQRKANGDARPYEEIISDVEAAYREEIAANAQSDSRSDREPGTDAAPGRTKATAH